MRRTIIHIGANKTASTTLQRSLFSKHSEIHYVGEDGEGYASYADLVNSMVEDDELHYLKTECAELFRQHREANLEKTLVYSNEDVMTSRIPKFCAMRLQQHLPDADILLVIRNQYTAVPSFYANHGAFLKPAPPSYFRRHVSLNDWINFETMFSKYGPLASFRYDRLASIYVELFGRERVHVLLFEEFVEDRASFMQKLSTLLCIDADEAVRLVQGSHERKRNTRRMLTYNKFRTGFLWGRDLTSGLPFGGLLARWGENYLKGGETAKIALNAELKQKVHALYSQDNASLAEQFHLPLGEYGYPLPP
jgi:hypothetical protein